MPNGWDIKGVKGKANAGGLKGAAMVKMNELLDEFNAAIPAIKDLGFAVKDLKVGMGVPPEVSAKLTGTVASIKKEKVQELIEANQDNKVLGVMLKGLQTAGDVQNKLGDLGFKGVEADVNLMPPTITVRFV
jgi:hypothetical protein